MKKASLAVLISLSALTGAAYAQTENGITMSTDPQKAADVEQRAQDLQQRQEAAESAPKPMKKEHSKSHHHNKDMKDMKDMKPAQ
jgi:Skp family chaperone for outer membrane proteins